MFQIISDQPAFLVIDKSIEVSSHPSPGDPGPDLVTLLGRDLLSPLTRLDRPASGLVLLSADANFKNNFELVGKTYLALVFGRPPKSGFIDSPLLTKRFTGQKVQQEAETEYEKLEQFKDTALLSVQINTGRHHQIRKHLRSIGCPLVGDFRHGYKDKNLELQNKYGQKIRLGLHCAELKFKYQKKDYAFIAKAPADLQALIDYCRAIL